jgi:hypothetical protein
VPRHAAGSRPVDDQPGPLAPDPRHRPVVLCVAPRPHSRPDPRSLPATVGTALAVVATMGLAVFSGWAGWRMAEAGAPAQQVLVAAPVVPPTPAADPQVRPADGPPPVTPVGQQPSTAKVVFSGAAASVPGAAARGAGTTTGWSTAGSVVLGPVAAVSPARLITPAAPTAAAPTVATPPAPARTAQPSPAAPSSESVASATPSAARPTATTGPSGPSGPSDSTRPRPRATGTPSAPGHRDEDARSRGDGGHGRHHRHGSGATSGRPASDGQEQPAEEASRTRPSTRGT